MFVIASVSEAIHRDKTWIASHSARKRQAYIDRFILKSTLKQATLNHPMAMLIFLTTSTRAKLVSAHISPA